MSVDGIRKALAVLCLAVIVVAVFVVQRAGDRPQLHNGDMLGQDSGETYVEYRQRASISLEQAQGERWALVSFGSPRTAEEAGSVVNALEISRLSTLVMKDFPPVQVPEPVAPATRADVISEWAPRDHKIVGILVFDDADRLRAIHSPDIGAIEVLPSGAEFSHFGLRPVDSSR